MSSDSELQKLLNKDSINMSDLQKLTNMDKVVSVTSAKSDRKNFLKYDVNLVDGELYYVYVKNSSNGWFNFG